MRMHTNQDIRPLHRIAVLATVDLVSAVTAVDLEKPTPCAGWNLADLLTHMTVQHRGFAAAARGQGADEAIWQSATVADAVAADPAGTYSAAATEVIDAFASDGVLDGEFALPEFGPGRCSRPRWRSVFTMWTTWCTAGMWLARWGSPTSFPSTS